MQFITVGKQSRLGGHDESARMFKPKYIQNFQMYKNFAFFLIGLG